jgi:catechol 2,3-dioxygenase-like lactoylglutathione lyase family enzyme
MPKLHGWLDARGIVYRDYPSGRDTGIVDDDGIRWQLSPQDGWHLLRPPAFAPDTAAVSGEPVFRPMAIEHVLLNVADPDASGRFYGKVLGPASRGANDRVWFQAGRSRIGLTKAPAGQQPGVHHICVVASPFDYDASIARLTALGATVEAPETSGAPLFRAPGGTRIEVSRAN